MNRLDPQPRGNQVHWLDAAPEDDAECRDYFVRLITLLSFKVDRETMEQLVAEALPSHGVKRDKPVAREDQ